MYLVVYKNVTAVHLQGFAYPVYFFQLKLNCKKYKLVSLFYLTARPNWLSGVELFEDLWLQSDATPY
jgi:hypothetical protein